MSGDAAPAGSALVQPAVLLRLARQGVRHHLADGPAEAAEGQAHRRSTSSPQQSARRSWAPGRAGPIWTCETPPSSGLLGASGLRRAEMLAMRRGDLDGRDSAPVRRGKGGKSRVVAFDAETSIAIRRYLRARDERFPGLLDESAPLFVARTGVPLSYSGQGQMMARLGRDCGAERAGLMT